LHVRLENGDRCDTQVEGRRLHTRLAEPDRDGRSHEAESRCHVEGTRDRVVKATESQTFAGESLLVRYVNFVKLPHTVFALPFALAPVALAFVSAYSYAKRFTHWSHLWLGLADGIATPAGYLAVTGRWSEPWWLLPVGALAVTFWVGGFDVFYALQDEAFDRAERLESLVVRLGQAQAILVAKLLHGLALVALVLFGIGAGLGPAYYVGVAVGAALIAWEHRLVKPGDLSRLNAAFFGANGI